MRWYILALLLFPSFLLSAQTTYKCTYADTLTVRLPATALNNMTLNIGGDLPDSVKAQVASMVRKQFSMKPLVQLQQRMVTAIADSTVVEFDPNKVVSTGFNMKVPYQKMILKGGKITSVYGSDSSSMDLPRDEARRFIATGARQTILNHECAEYKSGLVTIWVTSALPSSINPGIKNVDVPGAILAFTLESENFTTVSRVQAIQSANK